MISKLKSILKELDDARFGRIVTNGLANITYYPVNTKEKSFTFSKQAIYLERSINDRCFNCFSSALYIYNRCLEEGLEPDLYAYYVKAYDVTNDKDIDMLSHLSVIVGGIGTHYCIEWADKEIRGITKASTVNDLIKFNKYYSEYRSPDVTYKVYKVRKPYVLSAIKTATDMLTFSAEILVNSDEFKVY